MPSLQETLETISQNGNFRKVWSRVKDVIVNDDDLNKEEKLALAKLYKDFNKGLTDELEKFEKAKSSVKATKHASRAIAIIKEYEDKFAETDRELPPRAILALGGLLKGMREFLSKSLTQIDEDDMPATEKIKQLANDAKLHKIWSKLKKNMLDNDELDKDDKKALKKLYDSFDGGLSGVMKKFEKADSDEDAVKYAKEAIAVMDDYIDKLKKMSKEIPSDTYLALRGVLEEMETHLQGWVEEFDV
ncbi:MAG: hypothetical protein U0939_14900 [Pirellulales bacterium]